MRIITQRKEKKHMNVKDMACDEIKTDFENLKEVELGSEEFKTSVDGITKLMDRYIEMEKHDDEVKAREIDRKFDQELKRKQARDERIDRWIKNGLTLLGVLIPAGVTLWGARKSWKFEETGTVTSTPGRKFMDRLFSKK